MVSHAPARLAAFVLLGLLGCRGPTPAPKPRSGERTAAAGSDSTRRVRLPKFDVAPPGPTTRRSQRDPPSGFVVVRKLDPSIRIDIRYATADNFTGAPLPGYLPGAAWLTQPTADALAKVQTELATQGLALLVFDAYRPLRATKAMVSWAEATARTKLLDDGYIARASEHNRGNTVDLTLVKLEGGEELEMGTAWDTFTKDSHFTQATGPAMSNRRRLRKAMVQQGFSPYAKEWWHFTFRTDPSPPPQDVAYAQ